MHHPSLVNFDSVSQWLIGPCATGTARSEVGRIEGFYRAENLAAFAFHARADETVGEARPAPARAA